MRELIIGGARSGKSTLALQRAQQYSLDVVYVATAIASDAEMQTRIDRHRAERPAQWITMECPQALAATVQEHDAVGRCIVVDCLTLWLSNVLWPDESLWPAQRAALLNVLPQLRCQLILVSNEVGMGIVPDNAVARRFRDEQGWLNQAVASLCERVTLVVAGLPMTLKAWS